MTNDTFTIKQTSELLGISAHTLRYYEREGVFGTSITRNNSGHRQYTQRDILWFKLLLCLRQTGMPLEQVKTFATMSRQGSITLAERQRLLLQHKATLESHIASLQQALKMLVDKVARYNALLADEKTAAALEDQLLKQ